MLLFFEHKTETIATVTSYSKIILFLVLRSVQLSLLLLSDNTCRAKRRPRNDNSDGYRRSEK